MLDREVNGKENPRKHYAEGLRAEPAPLVRGSSRRITIMRFRPANIRVINRRENHLDHDLRCLLLGKERRRKPLPLVDRSLHISAERTGASSALVNSELRSGPVASSHRDEPL
jgi:hypothetical protein